MRSTLLSGFRTIVADPPWITPSHGRCSPHNHFVGRTDDWIARYLASVAVPAQVGHLYLWVVTTKVDTGFAIMREWGFDPCSVVVWVKATPREGGGCGPLQIGLGRNFRVAHELCLFGRRGDLQAKNWKCEPSVLFAPRGAIAGKPDAFYDMVERQSYGPYLELFARRRRKGWTCLGDQLDQ